MSSENSIIAKLLKKQEEERKDLAAGAYEAWLPVKEKEQVLLGPYNGQYETAPKFIKKEIDEAREKYFSEWGSDGKLASLMDSRHTKERERAAEKQRVIDKLNSGQSKNKDKDRGR